ncbi:Fatty acid synthase [Halotydeus destructor]|nr:Fatty acid synthase [Halotydeus destructor]
MSTIVDKFAALTKDTSSGRVPKRPLWLAMSPIGSYSPGMAKSLRAIPVFAASIERSSDILAEVNIDLKAIVYDETNRTSDFVATVVSFLAVEIALTDCLYSMGLKPDHIIGHSLGEAAAGYTDGATDARQTLLTAYRGSSAAYRKHGGKGALAAVGLSRKEAKRRCPPGVHVACSNGAENVAVSGIEASVKLFVHRLQAEGIRAMLVDSGGIPVHTPILEDTRPDIEGRLCPLVS